MWRLLPLLLLAACSGAPGGPCRLQQAADLAVTFDGNRLLAPAQVNGLDTQVLIDTGAERTVLSNATVDAIHLPRSQRSVTRLTGVGGAVSNADVFADANLGGVSVHRRLAVAPLPGLGGLVGGDVLSEYDLDLDLPNHRVRLWRAAGCAVTDLPLRSPVIAVPITVTDGRPMIPVTVDGKPVSALLDSGAYLSIMRAPAAQRLGVTQAVLAADPASNAGGMDGGRIGVRRHQFASLTLGGDRVDGPRIGVAEMAMSGTEMLLGMDYLRTRRVWIAYRAEQLFIARGP